MDRKDVNGHVFRDGVEVRRRWAEYFDQVLNVAGVREANINAVGIWWMPVRFTPAFAFTNTLAFAESRGGSE